VLHSNQTTLCSSNTRLLQQPRSSTDIARARDFLSNLGRSGLVQFCNITALPRVLLGKAVMLQNCTKPLDQNRDSLKQKAAWLKRNLATQQVWQKVTSRVDDGTERLYGNRLQSTVSVQVSVLDGLPTSCQLCHWACFLGCLLLLLLLLLLLPENAGQNVKNRQNCYQLHSVIQQWLKLIHPEKYRIVRRTWELVSGCISQQRHCQTVKCQY